jgi:hypothetical protein
MNQRGGGERLREAFPCESRGNGLLGHVGLEDGILGFEMGEKREVNLGNFVLLWYAGG